MMRFYEPLILISLLDPVQGAQSSEQPLISDSIEHEAKRMRRTILYRLSAMCDYAKGGQTVTAIAVEHRPSGPIYWISSNEDVDKKIKRFLEETLLILGDAVVAHYSAQETIALRDRLFEKFTLFNRPRLRKTWHLLQVNLRKAFSGLSDLVGNAVTPGQLGELRPFLERLGDEKDRLLRVCRDCYHVVRSSPLLQPHSTANNVDRTRTRHYMARMGATFQAATFLVSVVPDQRSLFENFEVNPVPNGPAVRGPVGDEHLTLHGIAKRMLPAESPDLPELVERLSSLNHAMNATIEDHETIISARGSMPNLLCWKQCIMLTLNFLMTTDTLLAVNPPASAAIIISAITLASSFAQLVTTRYTETGVRLMRNLRNISSRGSVLSA